MAYTQEQIDGARSWAAGKTGAEIASAASQLGLSASDLGTVLGTSADKVTASGYGSSAGVNSDVANATWGGYSAPSPSASSPSNVIERFTPEQYSAAAQWSNGRKADEIFGKASELGLTSDELGKVFGQFGGSGAQVRSVTGYGSGITGFNPDGSFKYNPSFGSGVISDGSKLSEWKFDSGTGWIKDRPLASITNEMPKTGINLSQLQSATPWNVESNQTVASQLERVIAADSPLMQQARMRAMQTANQRGLLNSSMAASAGESAVFDAAMPIAQQDANTYADSARFNAEASNTFSRDNNAFVRDAFMADFNLAANEWAKQQDQLRSLESMGVQQRLTLERDAIQNGYQSARDAILNGYDVTKQGAQNDFTASQQAKQNEFAAQQNELDRGAAMARANAGQGSDTSLQRAALQIDADNKRLEMQTQATARDTITNARNSLTTQLTNIEGTSGLSSEAKTTMMARAIDGYNTIVAGRSLEAGWNASDWSWKEPSAGVQTTQPAATTSSTSASSQTGDGYA